MRKITLLVFLLTTSMFVYAQKLKIDDGKVLIDKVPVAIIEGESGLLKGINLTYKSLAGVPLLNITYSNTNYFIPTKEELIWYKIVFFNPAVEVRYLTKGVSFSEKKLSELVFTGSKASLLNSNNEIDAASLKEFVSQNDATEKILKDSLDYVVYENALIGKLTSSKIERDLSKSVVCKQIKSNTEGFTKTTTYNITQNYVVIGSIEQEVETTSSSITTKYKVYKKYNTPEIVDGNEVYFGLAAYYKDSDTPQLITIQNKKVTEIKFSLGRELQEICDFMVKNNLL